jgi:hypothetical protein
MLPIVAWHSGNVYEETIRAAVEREGLSCCVAHVKPFLSQDTMNKRLTFAKDYAHWSEDHWGCVLWTDESAMHILG